MLAMINVSAIVSLRGMPAESTYGLSSVFYYIFAAVFFLVPVSLVAAELTTGWPQKGGVYRWVGEAFGKKWGFLAIWLQWIESTIWFPTVLTFAAVSLAIGILALTSKTDMDDQKYLFIGIMLILEAVLDVVVFFLMNRALKKLAVFSDSVLVPEDKVAPVVPAVQQEVSDAEEAKTEK